MQDPVLQDAAPDLLDLEVLPPSSLTTDLDAGAAPPIACSLTGGQRVDRVERWRVVLESATARRPIAGGVRVEFDPGRVDVAAVAELATAEAGCCGFLRLQLVFGRPSALEVRAPAEAFGVVVELFGQPTTQLLGDPPGGAAS